MNDIIQVYSTTYSSEIFITSDVLNILQLTSLDRIAEDTGTQWLRALHFLHSESDWRHGMTAEARNAALSSCVKASRLGRVDDLRGRLNHLLRWTKPTDSEFVVIDSEEVGSDVDKVRIFMTGCLKFVYVVVLRPLWSV